MEASIPEIIIVLIAYVVIFKVPRKMKQFLKGSYN